MQLRDRLYQQFDPDAWEGSGLSPLNKTVLSIVIVSVFAAVLESEPLVRNAAPAFFTVLTAIFAVCFTIEYALRLWAMGSNPEYKGISGRLRYAINPFALFDLIATITLWLDLLVGFGGVYGVLLRLARVLRVISLARKSAVGVAIQLLYKALKSRSMELGLSFGATLTIILIASTLLYLFEGEAQAEAFGSIPRAMWWSVATLTTVGYGDVVPVTVIGKILASIVALTSIALVAMPAGIMAAAFSDAFQDLHATKKQSPVDEDK